MVVAYYNDFEQGSEQWLAARRGILTASEMKLIITPAKLGYARNDKSRAHLYELAAQRITGYTEPHYVGDEMLRGHEDEIRARMAYAEKYEPVTECGFITNDKWGFTLGYSPDGLVGDDGLIECKSRRQKFQIETIINDAMPDDFIIQTQTGFLVSERKWCDFISYCGGMFMITKRIYPIPEIQEAIVDAATSFHAALEEVMAKYHDRISMKEARLIATERVIEQEMTI